jgi:hypothetical protein
MDLGYILVQIGIYLIILVIMTIFLKLALGLFSRSKNTNFGRVFVTSLLITIVLFIFNYLLPGIIGLIIALIIVWLIISGMHSTGFAYAIAISIIAFILYIVVLWITSLIFGITLIIFFPKM